MPRMEYLGPLLVRKAIRDMPFMRRVEGLTCLDRMVIKDEEKELEEVEEAIGLMVQMGESDSDDSDDEDDVQESSCVL